MAKKSPRRNEIKVRVTDELNQVVVGIFGKHRDETGDQEQEL